MKTIVTLAVSLILIVIGSSAWATALTLDFNAATGGTLLDSVGAGTGFTSRLPGTTAPAGNDALLTLNTGSSQLNLTSTQSDFNAGGSPTPTSNMTAPGIKLSSLGYTGTQDFSVTANFKPIPVRPSAGGTDANGIENIDQVGVYIGTDSQNLTRSGLIVFATPEYFSGHTTAGADRDGRFFGFGINVTDGMNVTISRSAGAWTYIIDGLAWHPNTVGNGSGTSVDPDGTNLSPNLNAAADLYVGVFAITPLNANPKTIFLDKFSATVAPVPGDANGDGHVDLLDFNLISDNLFKPEPVGTAGDLSFDGVVNYSDFRLWKNNYHPGSGAGVSSAVPEPSGIVLAIIAVLGATFGRRRIS